MRYPPGLQAAARSPADNPLGFLTQAGQTRFEFVPRVDVSGLDIFSRLDQHLESGEMISLLESTKIVELIGGDQGHVACAILGECFCAAGLRDIVRQFGQARALARWE